MILRGVQFRLTGLPAWRSGQPGQVGNQAALTVESVPGSRLVNFSVLSRKSNYPLPSSNTLSTSEWNSRLYKMATTNIVVTTKNSGEKNQPMVANEK